MGHKFHVSNKHKLDNEKRRELLPPEKILMDIGLRDGDKIADIGCGIGYFTFPASKIVGKSGRVYALDILPEMIEEIEQKIKENNSDNIITVLTEENNTKLEDNEVNYAFLCNVLHEAENKEVFLNEVKRIISKNGMISIVEWRKIDNEYGPPIDHRLDENHLRALLKDTGFNDVEVLHLNEHFYLVRGIKRH
ncbi:methyltransferase [Fervidicella metallireducens AeB]|uniref:Methyltransferase n=1 Tax=Fervidicella metallireducens AeB TaxID=1403537 RepID=A0A017RVS7_9CLOT|nr:methyltransferase domain-containing protein [Fervidicella metallireducens]EYE88883.1 methyltransferase [Fervidicella metallireducens AeB]